LPIEGQLYAAGAGARAGADVDGNEETDKDEDEDTVEDEDEDEDTVEVEDEDKGPILDTVEDFFLCGGTGPIMRAGRPHTSRSLSQIK
jgi:hypothetical protein